MIDRLEELGDDGTLAQAWGFLGRVHFFRGHTRLAETCSSGRRTMPAGRSRPRAGRDPHVVGRRQAPRCSLGRGGCRALWRSSREMTERSIGLDAHRLAVQGALDAMRGRFAEARTAFDAVRPDPARARARDQPVRERDRDRTAGGVGRGRLRPRSTGSARAGRVSAGWARPASAPRSGRRSRKLLVELGRDDEAEALLLECEPISQAGGLRPPGPHPLRPRPDPGPTGEHEAAERLALEALAIMEPTDYLDEKAETFVALADVLAAAGRSGEVVEALEQALALYEQKGNVVRAGRTRERLDALGRRRARLSPAATVRPRWRGAGRSCWASRTARPSRRSGGRACSRACATRSRRAAAR